MIEVIHNDCLNYLEEYKGRDFDLTFLDPPFNQGKEYRRNMDNLPEKKYWEWMTEVSLKVFHHSSSGSALYFMHREKNVERAIKAVRESGWNLQNVIIWKKKTSAVPSTLRFGKQYQIIVYATKGQRPRVFNRLRIDPPIPATYRAKRENGLYLTDIWDDIRELTSGYFAGDEAIRSSDGERFHKQQSPVQLLLRIILSSSHPGDFVFDPFVGTGTTLVVAKQLQRESLGVDIDSDNISQIRKRIQNTRKSDNIQTLLSYYSHTTDIGKIWGYPLEDNNQTTSDSQVQLSINVGLS